MLVKHAEKCAKIQEVLFMLNRNVLEDVFEDVLDDVPCDVLTSALTLGHTALMYQMSYKMF